MTLLVDLADDCHGRDICNVAYKCSHPASTNCRGSGEHKAQLAAALGLHVYTIPFS